MDESGSCESRRPTFSQTSRPTAGKILPYQVTVFPLKGLQSQVSDERA